MVRPTPPVGSKTCVVDTSVLIAAPDAIHHLTAGNTVIIPFPVLQELDRRRTDMNGVGYTSRQTIRFLDQEHDGVGYLRRVNTRPGERFGPCNPEQACARELIMDDQTLVVSLVGIAGSGKTLMALLSAYELYRAGRVSAIESTV